VEQGPGQRPEDQPEVQERELMTIVNPSDDGTPSAVQYTQSLLKEHHHQGIINPTTVAVAGAAQVVKQQGLCNKYVVTGLGDPRDEVVRHIRLREEVRAVELHARESGRDVRHARNPERRDLRQAG
jgi:hypothetical protein